MINLGDKVKDTITGYEGIVVADTIWLNGCLRVIVQSRELKDGVPVERQEFDTAQVELIEANVVTASRRPLSSPKQSPTRNSVSR